MFFIDLFLNFFSHSLSLARSVCFVQQLLLHVCVCSAQLYSKVYWTFWNGICSVLFSLCVDFEFVLFSQFLLKCKHFIILWCLCVCACGWVYVLLIVIFHSFFIFLYIFHRNTIDALCDRYWPIIFVVVLFIFTYFCILWFFCHSLSLVSHSVTISLQISHLMASQHCI